MSRLTSYGTPNRTARAAETHPLTWRLRDDGAPVWLEEYQSKNGYAAARKRWRRWPPTTSSRRSRTPASRAAAVRASPPA